MRLILAKVLWNFDLSLTEVSEGWAETQRTYTLWEKPPLMVKISRRTNTTASLADQELNHYALQSRKDG